MSYPDTQVVLAELAAQFEPSLTKKQVADSVSHLIRKEKTGEILIFHFFPVSKKK